MWQRIQTLYMLIALVLLGVAIANTREPAFLVLLGVGAAANLIPLFCFKHRMLQLRCLIFGAVVLLCLQIWIAYSYFAAEGQPELKYSMIFPLICVILDALAARGVFQDELIVRSSSRLRAAKRIKK